MPEYDILKMCRESKLCAKNYISKYFFIDKTPINISDYHPEVHQNPLCFNNHPLILKGTYFVHASSDDVTLTAIETAYKCELLSHFPITCITIKCEYTLSIYYSFSLDILLSKEVLLQLCNRSLKPYQVVVKGLYCESISKTQIWVIMINKIVVGNDNTIKLPPDSWISKSFINYNIIFLLTRDEIYEISPNEIKDGNIITIRARYNANQFQNTKFWLDKARDVVFTSPINVRNMSLEDSNRLIAEYIYNIPKVCREHYAKYAYEDGVLKHIDDVKTLNWKCKLGHEMIKTQDKTFFTHKEKSDMGNTKVSEWHQKFCGEFPCQELPYYKLPGQISNRYSDITIENSNMIVEVQHSVMDAKEVANRKKDYGLHHKKIIWVIDCTEYMNQATISIKGKTWKYNSFLLYKYIFWDFGSNVGYVVPNDIRIGTMVEIKLYDRKKFIDTLRHGKKIWKTEESISKVLLIVSNDREPNISISQSENIGKDIKSRQVKKEKNSKNIDRLNKVIDLTHIFIPPTPTYVSKIILPKIEKTIDPSNLAKPEEQPKNKSLRVQRGPPITYDLETKLWPEGYPAHKPQINPSTKDSCKILTKGRTIFVEHLSSAMRSRNINN